MPFFSIIIPAFNRAKIIEKAIISVKNQSFHDWECIIVDDGSTDNTKDIVMKLLNEDKRIKYVYQENAERSAARNNGIQHAIGNYICFLDSDDEFLEKHLENLYTNISLKDNPIAMFFTNFQICQNTIVTSPLMPVLTEDVVDYLVYNPIIPARTCIHKKILLNFQFEEDIVIVEDLLLWLRIALNYPVFQFQENDVIYNLHEDNSINIKNNAASKRLKGLKLFFNRFRDIRSKLTKIQYRFLIGDTHFALMKYYYYHNKKFKAFYHIILSIFYQRKHKQLKHKLLIVFKLLFGIKILEYSK